MNEHIPVKTYYRVFAALMVMLVLTVAAAYVPYHSWHLGALGVIIALIIATAKAVLVVLYFMHVKVSSRLTKLFVVTGLFWLGILFGLTFNDYLTRGWLPVSEGWLKVDTGPPEHRHVGKEPEKIEQ
jgi:cytochrome c oxidase subunit 4